MKSSSKSNRAQFTNIGNDLRFYADQRFKILGAFLMTNGVLANVASNHPGIVLGVVGLTLSYLYLSWEKRTTQWWGVIFESLKSLEKMAEAEAMWRAFIIGLGLYGYCLGRHLGLDY